MTHLSDQHCKPCEGGVSPLSRDDAQPLLDQLAPDWIVSHDDSTISKDFRFKGFNKTMGFVNAVAWIANQEGHHPDMAVGYGHCLINFSTHSIGGLSDNDFICAAKVDQLLEG